MKTIRKISALIITITVSQFINTAIAKGYEVVNETNEEETYITVTAPPGGQPVTYRDGANEIVTIQPGQTKRLSTKASSINLQEGSILKAITTGSPLDARTSQVTIQSPVRLDSTSIRSIESIQSSFKGYNFSRPTSNNVFGNFISATQQRARIFAIANISATDSN